MKKQNIDIKTLIINTLKVVYKRIYDFKYLANISNNDSFFKVVCKLDEWRRSESIRVELISLFSFINEYNDIDVNIDEYIKILVDLGGIKLTYDSYSDVDTV